jgi:hypothetical protein
MLEMHASISSHFRLAAKPVRPCAIARKQSATTPSSLHSKKMDPPALTLYTELCPPPEGLKDLEEVIRRSDFDAFKTLFTTIVVQGRNPVRDYIHCLVVAQSCKRTAIAEYLLSHGME